MSEGWLKRKRDEDTIQCAVCVEERGATAYVKCAPCGYAAACDKCYETYFADHELDCMGCRHALSELALAEALGPGRARALLQEQRAKQLAEADAAFSLATQQHALPLAREMWAAAQEAAQVWTDVTAALRSGRIAAWQLSPGALAQLRRQLGVIRGERVSALLQEALQLGGAGDGEEDLLSGCAAFNDSLFWPEDGPRTVAAAMKRAMRAASPEQQSALRAAAMRVNAVVRLQCAQLIQETLYDEATQKLGPLVRRVQELRQRLRSAALLHDAEARARGAASPRVAAPLRFYPCSADGCGGVFGASSSGKCLVCTTAHCVDCLVRGHTNAALPPAAAPWPAPPLLPAPGGRPIDHPPYQAPAAAGHQCVEADLSTADLIRSATKPCPNPACGVAIEKSSGCDQMFCVKCRIAFSWSTMRIHDGVGPFHNPHFNALNAAAQARVLAAHRRGGVGAAGYKRLLERLYPEEQMDEHGSAAAASGRVLRKTCEQICVYVEHLLLGGAGGLAADERAVASRSFEAENRKDRVEALLGRRLPAASAQAVGLPPPFKKLLPGPEAGLDERVAAVFLESLQKHSGQADPPPLSADARAKRFAAALLKRDDTARRAAAATAARRAFCGEVEGLMNAVGALVASGWHQWSDEWAGKCDECLGSLVAAAVKLRVTEQQQDLQKVFAKNSILDSRFNLGAVAAAAAAEEGDA